MSFQRYSEERETSLHEYTNTNNQDNGTSGTRGIESDNETHSAGVDSRVTYLQQVTPTAIYNRVKKAVLRTTSRCRIWVRDYQLEKPFKYLLFGLLECGAYYVIRTIEKLFSHD